MGTEKAKKRARQHTAASASSALCSQFKRICNDGARRREHLQMTAYNQAIDQPTASAPIHPACLLCFLRRGAGSLLLRQSVHAMPRQEH